MDPEKIHWQSYFEGYRVATCDLNPIPVETENHTGITTVLFAYLLGALVTYLYFKLGRE